MGKVPPCGTFLSCTFHHQAIRFASVRQTRFFKRDGFVGHEFGVRLALIGFATSAFQAAWMRSGVSTGVQEGLAAMIAFYIIGYICGETARLAIEEDFAKRAASTAPTPGSAGTL